MIKEIDQVARWRLMVLPPVVEGSAQGGADDVEHQDNGLIIKTTIIKLFP